MKWPTWSERTKERLAGLASLIVVVPMILLGQQAGTFLHAVWTDHWIRKDSHPKSAIVTHVGPKRMLEYRYTLNGREYAGRDSRSYEDQRDHPISVGEQITARVSSSHPWLSALGKTGGVWIGLPIFVIISVVEVMLFGILLSGVLRMFLGVSLVSEQAGPVITMIVSALFVVFLVTAVLGKKKNRMWQFRIYRRDG